LSQYNVSEIWCLVLVYTKYKTINNIQFFTIHAETPLQGLVIIAAFVTTIQKYSCYIES